MSEVSICNLTLAKIGDDGFITDISENSKAANLFRVFYEPTRDSVLRQYLWRFARKRQILAPLVDTPAFDGGSYFQIPTDCLRVVGTDLDYNYGYGRWVVEGDRIVADTDALNLVYIKRITDTALFDAIFVDALTSRLGDLMSMPLAKSQSLKDQMQKEFKELVVKAAFVGATEIDSQQFVAEAFIQVHY